MAHTSNGTPRISLKACFCWLLAPALLFLPLLVLSPLMVFGNSDALFYSNILAMMSDALKSGMVLPHWLPEANAGFGSAVMMFYAPLAYIVTAIINLPLALLHLDIGTQLMIGIYASQVASGYTSYRWLKRDFDKRTAFVGSLLFVLLPYKLIYIYLHINLAQLWALALLPLWMMVAEDITKEGRRAIGTYALALAGVYYMHPLTLIAFGAVPATYALFFGRRNLARTVLRLIIAHMLGAGMCMMQAFPAHDYIAWIHSELFLEGNYSWQNNFNHIDVYLCAYYCIVAIAVGCAILRLASLKRSATGKRGLFWIAVMCGAWFLTQRLSAFVWQRLPPLQYLQFPAARLHAPALLALIYLICIWLSHYREMQALGSIAFSRKTLAVFIALFTLGTCYRVYDVEHDPMHASDTYLGDARAAKIISTPVPIYETRWGCITSKDAYNAYHDGKIPAPVTVASGIAETSALVWSPPGRIAFRVDVKSPEATLSVRQCYIPLWQAHEADRKSLFLSPGTASGLIALTLPRGSHDVEITLVPRRSEAIGGIIATISLILSAVLSAGGKRKPHPAHTIRV